MFKKTMFVVGAIVAATMAMHGAASAAPLRHTRFHSVRFASRTFRRAHVVPLRAAVRSRRAGWSRVAGGRRGIRVAEQRRFAFRHRAYGWPRAALRQPALPRLTPVVASGVETGRASFYSGGGRTAAGGSVGAATCAHRSLPFGTHVLVTNLANARRAVLTVNDRGPFVRGRIVDVSVGAAGILGMLHSGTAPVSIQVVGGRG